MGEHLRSYMVRNLTALFAVLFLAATTSRAEDRSGEDLRSRIEKLEKQNEALRKTVENLQDPRCDLLRARRGRPPGRLP